MITLVKMKFGSWVYGTNIETSDIDIKEVFQPSAIDILKCDVNDHYNKSTADASRKNTSDDMDIEGFSLEKFLNLAIQGQTLALDMLFTPKEMYLTPPSAVWDKIIENRSKLLSKRTNAFVGYCRKQAAKYCVKAERYNVVASVISLLKTFHRKEPLITYREDIVNFCGRYPEYTVWLSPEEDPLKVGLLRVCGRGVLGTFNIETCLGILQVVLDSYGERTIRASINSTLDRKALYHAVRISREAEELLLTGYITFPRPEASLLLGIRRGEIAYEKISEIIEEGLIRVEEAMLKTTLPESPDIEFIEGIVFEENVRVVREYLSPS